MSQPHGWMLQALGQSERSRARAMCCPGPPCPDPGWAGAEGVASSPPREDHRQEGHWMAAGWRGPGGSGQAPGSEGAADGSGGFPAALHGWMRAGAGRGPGPGTKMKLEGKGLRQGRGRREKPPVPALACLFCTALGGWGRPAEPWAATGRAGQGRPHRWALPGRPRPGRALPTLQHCGCGARASVSHWLRSVSCRMK